MALTFGTTAISRFTTSVGLMLDELVFGSQLIYAIFDTVIELCE